MNYSILIYNSPSDFAFMHGPSTKQQSEHWAEWPKFVQAASEAGIFAGSAGLLPPSAAKTLRFSHDKLIVRDGSAADAGEQLGGFVNIDVPDLDAALEWAARCPRLPGQICEVRPHLPPPPTG